MQPVTRYQAADGSEWTTPELAAERDRLYAFARSATAPLGPPKTCVPTPNYLDHPNPAATAV